MAIGCLTTMAGESVGAYLMSDIDQGQTSTHPQGNHRHHHHRHHHHHNRMRMFDVHVKKLADSDAEIDLSPVHLCTCDNQDILDKIAGWGTTNLTCRTTHPKLNKRQNSKRTKGSAGSQTSAYGMFTRGENLREDEGFRFRHYDDTSLFMQQYREEHTICIHGADPCGPPILGRDTPDPYIAKLKHCGDLLERLVALPRRSRDQTDASDPSWTKEERFMKLTQNVERSRSDTSSPESSSSAKSFQRRKSINLAPVRDCRLAVTNIKFPPAGPPKKLQQSMSHQELPAPKATFPLPVRILVDSDTLKGNKLTSITPPYSPPRPRQQSVMRSESLERSNHAQKPQDFPLSKKKSEGDLRCPPCPKITSVTSDLSFSDPNLYRQYLTQRKKHIKADTTGHVLFGNHSNGSKVVRTIRKENSTSAPAIGLCELYSSTSGTLITATNLH